MKLLRERLDKDREDIFRKVEGAEEAMRAGVDSAEARGFLIITQLITSQHELYNGLFQTISAVEHLALHLEQLWEKDRS